MEKAEQYFNSEVVCLGTLLFRRMEGATVIDLTFQGGVVPVTLPLIAREPVSLNFPRRLFPPRGPRKGPFTERWTFPELAAPSSWEAADAVTLRVSSDVAARRALDTCRKAYVLFAFPDNEALSVLLAITTTRYGVQLMPVAWMPELPLPQCPTLRGDDTIGPFRRVLLYILPAPSRYLPDPKGRAVDGIHHFPSLKEVKGYVDWLSTALGSAAEALPLNALVPHAQSSGANGPSPLWTLLARVRHPVETLCCASNWVHAALTDGRLVSCDSGTCLSVMRLASRRLGEGGSWQMVHVNNSRAIYELCPAGSLPSLPPYHTLAALASGCFASVEDGVLRVACTSNLRAALCALALTPLGLNAVLFGAAQLSEADQQLEEAEAARLQNLEVAANSTLASESLDPDLLAKQFQGMAAAVALEASTDAASDSATNMEVDSSVWPPRSHAPMVIFSVAPRLTTGLGPSFVECCTWANQAITDALRDAVGVTPLAMGSHSLLGNLEGPVVEPLPQNSAAAASATAGAATAAAATAAMATAAAAAAVTATAAAATAATATAAAATAVTATVAEATAVTAGAGVWD